MTEDWVKLIRFLKGVGENATNVREGWTHFDANGSISTGFSGWVEYLIGSFDEYDVDNYFSITFDGNHYPFEEMRNFEDLSSFEDWRVMVSKEGFFSSKNPSEILLVGFSNEARFSSWASSINPFSENDNPFLKESPLKILIGGTVPWFGGPRLAIGGTDTGFPEIEWPQENFLPDDSQIKKQVNVLTKESIIIEPNSYAINWGEMGSNIAYPIKILLEEVLLSCLVQEFVSRKNVYLKGVKNIEVNLSLEGERKTSFCIDDLIAAVEWVYSERSETRAKLLADRLSLDLEPEEPLSIKICDLIGPSIKQAKEQYSFVIKERADQHVEEVKELLKDVREQAELYSNKVRDFLNAFLRDVLASIFVFSLSMLGRIPKEGGVISSRDIEILFYIVGVYFLLSMVLQNIINFRDMSLSKKEVHYWSEVSRDLVGIKEAETHIDKHIPPREKYFWWASLGISALYVILAVSAFYFQSILEIFGLSS